MNGCRSRPISSVRGCSRPSASASSWSARAEAQAVCARCAAANPGRSGTSTPTTIPTTPPTSESITRHCPYPDEVGPSAIVSSTEIGICACPAKPSGSRRATSSEASSATPIDHQLVPTRCTNTTVTATPNTVPRTRCSPCESVPSTLPCTVNTATTGASAAKRVGPMLAAMAYEADPARAALSTVTGVPSPTLGVRRSRLRATGSRPLDPVEAGAGRATIRLQ